jgi:hypothetical protein
MIPGGYHSRRSLLEELCLASASSPGFQLCNRHTQANATCTGVANPKFGFIFGTAQCANFEFKPPNWRCFGLLMHSLMLLQPLAEKNLRDLSELRKL